MSEQWERWRRQGSYEWARLSQQEGAREAHEAHEPHRCEACRRAISHPGTCADCAAEIEHLAELARLRAGIGSPDERADYDAAQRMIQSGE